MNIDQPSAIVLAALIAACTTICIAIIEAHAKNPSNEKSGAQRPTRATEDEAQITITTRQRSEMRRPTWRKSLAFIAWGQFSLLGPQLVDGVAPLSNWSASFIGQGSVMLLLGFWLLLRD